MDNIKVTLDNYTPVDVPLKAIAKPYRNQKPTMELMKNIMNSGHTSTIEHIVFHFNIEGVSRLLLQEFSRHRMASETVESTRYCLVKTIKEYDDNKSSEECADYAKICFVFPDIIRNNVFLNKKYTEFLECCIVEMQDVYEMMKTDSSINLNGERITDVLKYWLPESFRTNIYWTVNLRSLKNFISLRSNKGAHFEIRKLARMIYDEIMKTPYATLMDNTVLE